MDISKLPRMSHTPGQAPSTSENPTAEAVKPAVPSALPVAGQTVWCMKCHAPNPPGTRFCGSCGEPLAGAQHAVYAQSPRGEVGIEAWISIGLGVILLLMNPQLLQYLSHVMFGSYFAPYVMPDGTQVPYTDQLDFWNDLGITLFALVLIVDGVILVFSRKAWLIAVALGLTIAATVYNLGYLTMTFNRGLALLSAFAVLFGVYIAVYQWKLWNARRRRA